ncbi:MAG: hypothetical protein KF822_12470 [Steroidobacteraceae bacterium]|nr:hypothetical protein [Steroidobacteraceae bacterium]
MIEFVGASLTRSQADGRYVRRFVGATLTADTYLGDNASGPGQEVVLSNPSGPIMGALPLSVPPALYEAGDGGRFANRVKIFRLGLNASIRGGRVNGSYAAPLAVTAGEGLFNVESAGWDGVALSLGGRVGFVATEPWGPAARGTRIFLGAVRDGSTSLAALLWESPSVGLGLLSSALAQVNFHAGVNGVQLRNSLNTLTQLRADDVGLFAGNLPTSPGSLPAGYLWCDTGAGNVIKRV